MSTKKITIRGKTFDLNEVSDLVQIQSALVPANWPIKRAEGVRLFLSMQNMLALELKRHLAANFKNALKAAIEEGEEPGGRASIGINFAFEIDVTAPQVAALTKTKMSFSVRHQTEGKPKTHDLNQGEFLDDDMSVILDTKSLEREAEEAEKKSEEPPPIPPTPEESQTPPGETEARKVDKPKRSSKKKTEAQA